MRYWLMKSEPSEQSVDDLAALPGARTPWFGVRGYAARNFMRDDMTIGDLAFFYHSSCPEPGIVGIVKIVTKSYPDSSQFDPQSHYYDPKSSPDNPRWMLVDVELVRKLPLVSLASLRENPSLAGMRVLQKANRLSITPVESTEWDEIHRMFA
jgi:predicted RNA-binding protein with PUA-like domain